MRPATLDLIPHALHVMQVVGLVAVLGEHGCSLLSLLYLPSSKLPLGSLAVQKPASMQQSLLVLWTRVVCWGQIHADLSSFVDEILFRDSADQE